MATEEKSGKLPASLPGRTIPKVSAGDKDQTAAPEFMNKTTGIAWKRPSKPNFVKVKAGEFYEGIFMGLVKTQYGPGYQFRSHAGDVYTIGGNRTQIDQLFTELLGSPQGYVGDTIIGHALIVGREQDIESKSGRKVAQYIIGHDLTRCPKGCK